MTASDKNSQGVDMTEIAAAAAKLQGRKPPSGSVIMPASTLPVSAQTKKEEPEVVAAAPAGKTYPEIGSKGKGGWKLGAAFRKHSNGKKAFKLATEGNFRDALELIDKGGDVNYIANYSYVSSGPFPVATAARCNMGYIALEEKNMQALEELLKRGLNPNAEVLPGKNVCGGTSHQLLEIAILRKNKQAVDLLVKAGARTEITLANMKTIEKLAKEKGIKLPAAP